MAIAFSNFCSCFEVDAKDIGIDLIEDEAEAELLNMVKQSKSEKQDESFCIFDMGSVVERFQLWKKAFPPFNLSMVCSSSITILIAVKAYDDPVVIKLLNVLGAGFDCASKGEIELALKVGVKPENILFANIVKFPTHLSYAAEKGVSLMTFDSKNELDKIKEMYPHARLLLRICPTSKPNVEYQMMDAFGCYRDEVPGLIKKAKLLDLSLVGVSFHIGSGNDDPESFLVEINNAKEVFNIAQQEGINMSILDIGGGFHGVKGNEEYLLKMSVLINECIDQNFPNARVISEPGRYFVDSGLALAASVIGRRDGKGSRNSLQEVPEFWLSVSAFGLLNHSIAKAPHGILIYHPSLVLREPESPDAFTQGLRGPTCAPYDLIYCAELPQLQVGDWLIFDNMGAYSVTMASAFNSFYTPPIRRVMKKNVWEALVSSMIGDNGSGSFSAKS